MQEALAMKHYQLQFLEFCFQNKHIRNKLFITPGTRKWLKPTFENVIYNGLSRGCEENN